MRSMNDAYERLYRESPVVTARAERAPAAAGRERSARRAPRPRRPDAARAVGTGRSSWGSLSSAPRRLLLRGSPAARVRGQEQRGGRRGVHRFPHRRLREGQPGPGGQLLRPRPPGARPPSGGRSSWGWATGACSRRRCTRSPATRTRCSSRSSPQGPRAPGPRARGRCRGPARRLTTNTARSPGRDFAEREIERLDDEIGRSEDRIDALNRTAGHGAATRTSPGCCGTTCRTCEPTSPSCRPATSAMLDRYITAGFAGEVQIVEQAYAVPDPIRPDPVTLTAAGLVGGAAAGGGAAAHGRGWTPVAGRSTCRRRLQIHLDGVRCRALDRWGDDQTHGTADTITRSTRRG